MQRLPGGHRLHDFRITTPEHPLHRAGRRLRSGKLLRVSGRLPLRRVLLGGPHDADLSLPGVLMAVRAERRVQRASGFERASRRRVAAAW
jgi:hypothetical protein